MRFVYFLLSLACTVALIWALNTRWQAGATKTPRLGYFLSPQKGFWQNAESVTADFNAEIKAPELNGKAAVYIDNKLIPHVFAENDFDAYFVQGYLHAKFRLWQMEFQTHVAAGRLSEVIGKDGLNTDRFFSQTGNGIRSRASHGCYRDGFCHEECSKCLCSRGECIHT